MKIGLPEVIGSVETSSAPIHTPTPVETQQTYNGRPLPLSPGASDLRGYEAARGRIRGLADKMG